MQPHNPISSAQAQAQLADHIRNPALPAPPGIAPERLAVYTRLVRNNIKSFLDLCFSDSSLLADSEQWQGWQNRFLIEAHPESPFFNDIPPQFLAYLNSLPQHERPSENMLAVMDFETALLHAETAIQPDSDGRWHEHSVLSWAPAAQLQYYPCDFVSIGPEQIEDSPCHVLTWRNRSNEVYYRTIEGTDLFLLQHFQRQSDTFTNLLAGLQELLPEQDVAELLKPAVNDWVDAGVLLTTKSTDGTIQT
ncbi:MULTISPECIES: DUF2063 domain-containing protein [unclassified Neisseria]|uniref:HvfC family RiPP maturation protein n=1 Tax=unclassified Neisseria TaxID=2623750 RepID=UPI0010718795|nr:MULTISPECIES: putative DNA-binding domain-containing protein [unclassified Neisseria]MBF0804996.1 putative DNA-binding domain-containing protein [Neisseria sp. 19428wB4_WF04]TFU39277.1 DUF2063 domain-containing protein [Neisseria sp. WF04]